MEEGKKVRKELVKAIEELGEEFTLDIKVLWFKYFLENLLTDDQFEEIINDPNTAPYYIGAQFLKEAILSEYLDLFFDEEEELNEEEEE